MTPAHARAQADQLDAEAIEAAKAGDIHRGVELSLQANRLRELAAQIEGLPGVGKRRTIRTDMDEVDTTGQPGIVKRAAARSRRNHPAQAALYNAGVTIQGLADALGEKRARVSHWMGSGDVLRSIPKAYADRLERGIPVTKADGTKVTLRIPRDAWRRIAE